MKCKFAIGTASLAILASLSSTAHAQGLADTVRIDENLLADTQTNTTVLPISSISELKPLTLGSNAVEANYGDIDPFYGNIDPFYGNIDPFYGDIDAFWGNINPFYGDINPFYGNIDPFYGDINPFYGNISPFYGDINAFWGNISAFYGDISPFNTAYLNSVGNFWQDATQLWVSIEQQWDAIAIADPQNLTASELAALGNIQAMLTELCDMSKQQWGSKVVNSTGETFVNGFAAEIFARHGIDLNDPASLVGMTATERAHFYMDWHDSLMTYSGIDHVDHWMGAINWTPALTQQQGSGGDSVIGIIDSSVVTNADLMDNVWWSGGNSADLGGHGAGVASLIYAAHDGKGVMGIAPNAKVTTYNPFADDGTAEWADITAAIVALKSVPIADASVINLSLGESGWTLAPGINDVFSNAAVAAFNNNTIYVVAAGNDGLAQTQDIEWNFATDPALIVVGSTNPTGAISYFSNQPGTACLLDNGVCHDGNQLMNRFIVAPGELMLVSDGQGGLVRRSGTSFAAPLVSGAITLMHDRWAWLADHPEETAEIIFRSARDLGDPGVDEVYGWGMLDVLASQSPLDFNALTFTLYQKRGKNYRGYNVSADTLTSSGLQSWWETDDVFFHMIEYVGSTHRDFAVPMSTVLYGKRSNVSGSWEYLQNYVSGRFAQWILSGGSDTDGDGRIGFSDMRSTDRDVNGGWSLRYDAVLPRYTDEGVMRPTHMAASMTDPSGKVSMSFGYGQGAMALSGGRFNMVSDHDRYSGGVNPVLGFASGDTFASARYQFNPRTGVKLGFSQSDTSADDIVGINPTEHQLMDRLEDHRANAMTLEIDHRLSSKIDLALQYTRLDEKKALFGTQSTLDELMGAGTSTQALTATAAVDLGSLSVDFSATAAMTDTNEGQAFATSAPVLSSAGQLSLTKHGLLGKRDALRLSVAQPLNIERGNIELVSLGVVDRQTGELGEVVQSFSIAGKRRLVGEAAYATPLGKDGELALFGRYEGNDNAGITKNYVLGGSLSLRF